MKTDYLMCGLLVLTAIVVAACGDPLRGPGVGRDSAVTLDGSAGDGATGDASIPDGTIGDSGARDTAASTDSATTGDGSTLGLGQCEPTCLASGGTCCTFCGACNMAEVMCEPFCAAGQRWDCELNCCYDTTLRTCVE